MARRGWKTLYSGEPREIEARFASRCPETGKEINIGDKCVYFPKAKKTYHIDSRSAEEFRSRQAAEAFGLGDANW